MINIIARDLFLNALAVFILLVILILPFLNPPTEATSEPPPGNLSIYAAWPPGPSDIDLWVLAPGEPGPVGFSNKTGQTVSLLRDDLGQANDSSPANFENAYARDTPAGEWVINIHCFNCQTPPVPVEVEVRIAMPGEDSLKVFSTRVELVANRQEITVVRFRLNSEGRVVRNSMHSVFKPLFGARTPEP